MRYSGWVFTLFFSLNVFAQGLDKRPDLFCEETLSSAWPRIFKDYPTLVENIRKIMEAGEDWESDSTELIRSLEKYDLRTLVERLQAASARCFTPHELCSFLEDTLLGLVSRPDLVQRQMLRESSRLQSLYHQHWAAPVTGRIISSNQRSLRELEIILNFSKRPNAKFVDIGSGHGVPGILLGLKFPDIDFLGFEIVRAKVLQADQIARQMRLNNVHFQVQDVASDRFTLPLADYYFLYNPVNKDVAKRMAQQIRAHAQQRAELRVITTRGGDWITEIFLTEGCREETSLSRNSILRCD